MTNNALLYIIKNWPIDVWVGGMRKLAPGLDLRVWPDTMGDPRDIAYAVAWLPPADLLKSLPNLEVIFSLGAGVDAILNDPTLPANIPVVRVNDPDLTMRMSEYVVLHVLMHHRQQRRLDANQKQRVWDSFPTHAAKDLKVGIMGMGVLGTDAARKLAIMGFDVAGWSRSRKDVPGVKSYAAEELDAFLARTDILVSLLPHTPETTGLIDAGLIAKLSRQGPFGAPILINAGRGKQQIEADILAALDTGALFAATLDVFETEPLPDDSPLWTHAKVTVTPHCAADSDPATICSYLLRQIERAEAGAPLENVVDRKRGY